MFTNLHLMFDYTEAALSVYVSVFYKSMCNLEGSFYLISIIRILNIHLGISHNNYLII